MKYTARDVEIQITGGDSATYNFNGDLSYTVGAPDGAATLLDVLDMSGTFTAEITSFYVDPCAFAPTWGQCLRWMTDNDMDWPREWWRWPHDKRVEVRWVMVSEDTYTLEFWPIEKD